MKVEIRNDSVTIDGYVNVVQRDSRPINGHRGKFIEQISPNAFKDSLQKRSDVDLLFNHRNDRKLGGTKEGNLELREDVVGLRATCTVTDPEVIAKCKAGELRGWSFGFYATETRWSEDGERRYVDGLELTEVSILDCTPAYIATTIEARGAEFLLEMRSEEQEVTVIEAAEEKREEQLEIVEPDYSVVDLQIQIDKLRRI